MTAIDRPDTLRSGQKLDAPMAWLTELGRMITPAARHSAKQIGRAAQPALNHVRRNPAPYAIGALVLGAGLGLLLSSKARNAVGDALAKSWNMASDSDLVERFRR